MKFWPLILAIAFAGCARFHPEPISPENSAANFDARSLTNENLRAFLDINHFNGSWDVKALTLVAFYYQPALAEARAQFASTQAGEITAGARPNPTIGFTPTYDSSTPPPWIFGVTWDLPIETAGKRGKRIAQAKHLSEAAKWNFVSAAWQARSRVRAGLLGMYAARQTESLLARQETAQSNVVRLLEGRREAGDISGFEVTQARVILENTQLARQDAIGQYNQSRAQLAGALGIPLRALNGVKFSFDDFKKFPDDLASPKIRREAILSRADIRAALAQYAATQSALQLEIAKQYPDVHLGPGYELDQTDNKWSLGVTMDLPILNQNQGAIAEAEANRRLAAAHFLAVQAAAISEIDSAFAGYEAALNKTATASSLVSDLEKQLNSFRAQAQLGEADALSLAGAEADFAIGTQNQLNATVQAQQALGALQDAVQSPLMLPENSIRAAQNDFSKIQE